MSAMRSRAINVARKVIDATYSAVAPRHLTELIDEMNGARSTGVGTSDYLALYRHVLERRPTHVMELGAGQSSAAIALARQELGLNGRFIAVEEDPKWLEHHREVIPQRLLTSIDLIQRDATADGDYRSAHYINLPHLPYEFVHVDGPQLFEHGATVSRDVLDLLPMLSTKCLIVFDGREASARFARPYLESAGFKTRRHPFTLSYEFIRG